MASITLAGILKDSIGQIDVGAIVTFTHLTTTGQTIKGTSNNLIVPPDGAYSINVEYGQIRIDYTTRFTERFVAIVLVNSDSTATTLPDLLLSADIPTNPQIAQFQAYLADTIVAKDAALAAQAGSEAAEATLLAIQLTTAQLIASTVTFPASTVINTTGFTTSADGGKGGWKQNGVTGQPVSRTPAQLNNNLLNDGSGVQWAMILNNTVEFDTFANLELSTIGNIYQRLVARDNLNAEYILQPSTYSAVTGDATLANGLIAKLQLINLDGDLSQSYEFPTLANAVSFTGLVVGKVCNVKERSTGNGGGGKWDVVLASTVTANTFNIVACTGVPTLALVLRTDGVVNVKQFGAAGDGIIDDSSNVQAAIAYAQANRTNSVDSGSDLDGYMAIYFPQGNYAIDTTIVLFKVFGLTLVGDGMRSSQIICRGTTTLFNMSVYIAVDITGLAIKSGTTSLGSDGKLLVTAKGTPGARTDTMMTVNANATGTMLNFSKCYIRYFSEVLNTESGAVNGDNTRFDQCIIKTNDTIWINKNTQAVVCSVIRSKLYDNGICFEDMGTSFAVTDCDVVSYGTFYKTTGIASLGGQATFTNVRFETRADTTGGLHPYPRILDTAGPQSGKIKFDTCLATFGYGSFDEIFRTDGLYDVVFDACDIKGKYLAGAGTSANSILPSVSFIRCGTTPEVIISLSGSQGNTPINLTYEDSVPAGGGSRSVVTRKYRGVISSGVAGSLGATNHDIWAAKVTLSSSTASFTIPFTIQSPYNMLINNVSLISNQNGNSDLDVTIYSDASKTIIVASGTIPAHQNNYVQLGLTIPLNMSVLNSAVDALYVDLTATGNAGICKITMDIESRQVAS